ncbi:hypothetical protein BU16DRAFT_532415 [Lophium mytilinum]|uniref:Uncharacterized protein n=1 Tax=Lophium mytilinum TaxID=390894 RepID=A0A6A6RC94_9PEZI|nr:hypothetical protein BU16DRAFT_532415 [Lophium mytilinum]
MSTSSDASTNGSSHVPINSTTAPSPSRLVDFLAEPNAYYPIFDSNTRNLEANDLLKLRHVSKSLTTVYPTVQKTQWNVNEALKKFVKDRKEFRNKLGLASCVISGQFALDFLDRSAVGDRLDIFAHGKMGGLANAEYMAWWIEHEGYAVVRSYPYDDELMTEVYVRPGTSDPTIYLQNTRDTPIVSLLRVGPQYSLALANIMTSTKVYAPFARDTFREHRSYLNKLLDDYCADLLTAVAQTGRRMLDIRHIATRQGSVIRQFTDGSTWTMELNNAGIDSPTTPDYVVDFTTFAISVTRKHPQYYYWIDILQISHPALAYTWAHLCSPKGRLDAAMAMELSMTPRDNWPGSGNRSFDDILLNGDHLKPDLLALSRYYDDMLTEWLEEELLERDDVGYSGW